MHLNLSKKTIIISGISRGIGKALAIESAKKGMQVAGFDINAELIDTLSKELDQLQTQYFLDVVDIRNHEACEQFIDSCIKQFGGIDILINNAGITHIAPESETTIENATRLIHVNLLGTMALSHIALPYIINKKGVLVGISSVAGYSPLLYRTAYAASKHGVWGFLSSLRAEMRDKQVQVLTVCPSFVATDLQENQQQYFNKHTKEVLTPEFVAQEIFKAIENQKELAFIGKTAIRAYWLNKLFPKLYEKIMIKKMKVS